MKALLSLVMLLIVATAARAHFVWIIPDEAKNQVRVVMSETPAPDDPGLLDKISQTLLQVRDAGGKVTALTFKKGKDALEAEVPNGGPCTVGGVCRYGVMQRGKSDPFLLMYHAKAYVGGSKNSGFKTAATKPWDRLALEIMPNPDKPGEFQVLWAGKPLADAEVVAMLPGVDEPVSRKTDANGNYTVDATKSGVYGMRVRHIEAKAGEHDGKPFKEVRHYATLVVRLGS